MKLDREWLLVFVDPLGDIANYQIVAHGAEPRGTRKLKNEFRGAALQSLVRLISEAIESRSLQINSDLPEAARGVLGPTAAVHPILSADHSIVVALQIWSGSLQEQPPDRPVVGSWDWVLDTDTAAPAPPQLHMDGDALDLVGVESEYRDRTVFGPADLYTRSARLSDSLRHLRKLRDYTPNESTSSIDSSSFIIARGELRQHLHYAERPFGTRHVRGVCWVGNDTTLEIRESMLDSWLCTVLASASNMYVGVGDTSYKYPYFVKWLTDHVPGLGHGVSTGGTFALHPDDLPNVFKWISEVQKGNRIDGRVRARKGGGGFLSASFTGLPLDPHLDPNIGLVLIQPDVETVEE